MAATATLGGDWRKGQKLCEAAPDAMDDSTRGRVSRPRTKAQGGEAVNRFRGGIAGKRCDPDERTASSPSRVGQDSAEV
jgi:hypothetical protein